MKNHLLGRLNIYHIVLILAFPIGLALINPNWVFNVQMWDDYFYLGYQTALPRYVDWLPSVDHYFIERISWLAPTYHIRQLFSPLLSNFIIHFMVYYVTIFALYGTINRLWHARIALVIALLLGQFSLFLRGAGWDYIDGFTTACLTLSVFFITYAVTTDKLCWRWYLIGCGACLVCMVNANIFNAIYLPAIVIYGLFLNEVYHRKKLLYVTLWILLGCVVMFIALTLYYYQLTGRWFIFGNTLAFLQKISSDTSIRDIANGAFANDPAYWHIFFIAILLLSWRLLVNNVKLDKKNQKIIMASVSFFILSYSTVWLVSSTGTNFFRFSFYHTPILPSAFLVLAIPFAPKVAQYSPRLFNRLIINIVVLAFICFALFSAISITEFLLVLIIILVASLFLTLSLSPRRQRVMLYFVLSIMLFSYLTNIDARYIKVYRLDRYHNQRLYELSSQSSKIILSRYDDLSHANFYFWFDFFARQPILFNVIYAPFLHERAIYLDPLHPIWDDKLTQPQEIILLTTPDDMSLIMESATHLAWCNGYTIVPIDQYLLGHGAYQVEMIFIKIVPISRNNMPEYRPICGV